MGFKRGGEVWLPVLSSPAGFDSERQYSRSAGRRYLGIASNDRTVVRHSRTHDLAIVIDCVGPGQGRQRQIVIEELVQQDHKNRSHWTT